MFANRHLTSDVSASVSDMLTPDSPMLQAFTACWVNVSSVKPPDHMMPVTSAAILSVINSVNNVVGSSA